MQNAQPQSQNITPKSSMKEMSIKSESSSPNLSKANLPIFSKSAIVFKPSTIDSPLSNQKKKMTYSHKNSPNLRAISTKFGNMVFSEQTPIKRKVISKPKKVDISEVKQEEVSNQKINISLSAIGENPTPENIKLFFKKPIFLGALINDKKIDQNIVNLILKNISKDDLYFFMNTMATELTLHSSLVSSYTLHDVENNISKILFFKKVLVWYKPYNSDYLISPTLREIVPLNRSIVGYCSLKQKKLITNDPAMSPGFDIDYDLPILRGSESMALYPVISDFGDVSGVIQFVDLQSQDKADILPISKYEQSLLKLVTKLVKRQIFTDEFSDIYVPKELIQLLLFCGSGKTSSAIMTTANISSNQVKGRPSTSYLPTKNDNRGNSYSLFSPSSGSPSSATNFSGKRPTNSNDFIIDDNYFYSVSFSFENVISNMISFMKKYFDCEGVDIFEFDSDKKRFIQLIDGSEFSESAVGLSFLSVIKDEPVFVANGLHLGFPRSKLDRKFSNNSVLTVSYKYKYHILNEKDKSSAKINESKEKSDTNNNDQKGIEMKEPNKSDSNTANIKANKTNESNQNKEKNKDSITENPTENQNKEPKKSTENDKEKSNKIDNDLNPKEIHQFAKNNSQTKQDDDLFGFVEFNNGIENDQTISTSQFVFTLRSKWKLPSFLPDDLKKMNDISMILCACIHNVQINRSKNIEIKKLQRENFLIRVLETALTNYNDHKDDKWNILRKAANEIFGASNCFVCSFDGMMIHFHPTDVTCRFDQCIAGKAFNLQKTWSFG